MPVVSTQKVLYKISELCKQQPKYQLAEIQSKIIATPLMKLFPEASPEAIHHELLRNGLFEPIEWVHLNKTVQQLEENNVWEVVKKEIPLNRIGKTIDIAKCVKWLVEDEYTTGQVIEINGGWNI